MSDKLGEVKTGTLIFWPQTLASLFHQFVFLHNNDHLIAHFFKGVQISPILTVVIHCMIWGQKCTQHYRRRHSASQCLLNTYHVIVLRVLHISTHVITRTSNSEITYIYTSPLIQSTLLRLWNTAIVERMLALGKKKNWIQIQFLILTGCDLRKISHCLYLLCKAVVLKCA